MSKQLCYAACSFGLEAVVARQLEQLGLEEVGARDARVYFRADEEGIARANLWLSAAERVYLVLSEFSAATFEELFQGVKAIAWADYLPKTALFPVLADSVRSTLKSVPDIQSVSKKSGCGGAEKRIWRFLLSGKRRAVSDLCEHFGRSGQRVP